jgi:hypothetical protein
VLYGWGLTGTANDRCARVRWQSLNGRLEVVNSGNLRLPSFIRYKKNVLKNKIKKRIRRLIRSPAPTHGDAIKRSLLTSKDMQPTALVRSLLEARLSCEVGCLIHCLIGADPSRRAGWFLTVREVYAPPHLHSIQARDGEGHPALILWFGIVWSGLSWFGLVWGCLMRVGAVGRVWCWGPGGGARAQGEVATGNLSTTLPWRCTLA